MLFKIHFFEKKSIAPKTLMIFTRQLATLIEAGLPLLHGLAILSRQEKDPVLRKVILNIGKAVHSGESLSESLKRHPTIFNKLFVHMVQAGEAGGILVLTFLRLAEFQEKAHKLRNKIIAAMSYPSIILLITFCILCFLLGVIIPKFQEILPEMLGDRSLPPLTKFVTKSSSLLKENIIIVLAGCFLFFIGLRYLVYKQKYKHLVDSWKLRVPLVGNLIRQHTIAHGVPLLQGLKLTQETIENTFICSAIDKIYNRLEIGESMSSPLEASNIFPPMVVSMLSVGEESGRLPQMLLKIADIYDEEVESAIVSLTSLIEPVIIIFLALVVGGIVFTLFLPLISMAENFPTL